MKYLIIFFLLLPSIARAQEPYERPQGKIEQRADGEVIVFTKDEFATWAKIYADYQKMYKQKQLADAYESLNLQIQDLYKQNMASCEDRFKLKEDQVKYWQERTDAEKDAKFKALRSLKLETTLYQVTIGVETAAIVALAIVYAVNVR